MSQPINDGMDHIKQSMPQKSESDNSFMHSRNPITGTGLNGDGVGGLKPKIAKSRVGNPVTGEGYKAGHTDYEEIRKTYRRQATFEGQP